MTLQPGQVIIPPEWLAAQQDLVTIVDVRPPLIFRQMGHIPGAVNIPFDRLRDPSSVTEGMLPDPDTFASLLGSAGIRPSDPIVAYDDDKGVYASRFLLTAAVYGHHGPLYLLDGDYTVWQQAHDTAVDTPDPSPATYEIDPPADSPIVDREAVKQATKRGDLLIDTRTPVEYDDAHIPGAVQLSWEALVDDATRQLKPREDIETILEDIGITPHRRLVLYCNTARRLSHTYAVLRHLGYEDLTFYEGSLTDWVRAAAPDWDPTALQRQTRRIAPGGVERLVEELGDDVFNRLKLVGLYHQRQEGYFMFRTKIPGGILTAEQAEVIGNTADEFARAPHHYGGTEQNPIFGDGFLDITTRQDIQMHWIQLENVPKIWDRYAAVGLTSMQACGNSVRNVVSCPAAGLSATETIDVRPIVDAITERFLGDHTYANLPRKFKIAITGCHENCARAQINDLAFTPAVKHERDGFTVLVGGGLSDGPRMASDLDVFIAPEQVVEVVEAACDLFMEYGSYLDTAVNRLRFLVEELGVEAVRDDLARRVPFELEPAGESLTADYRGDHVGVHRQQDGRRYVGVNVPTGRMRGAEFAELAELARTYGESEVRLTANQNALLPHVPRDQVAPLLAEPLLERYRHDPGPYTRGVVACTGREFCNFGIIETKTRAIRWAHQLDAWAADHPGDHPEAIRVHLSGCSASCAQPQIADIGLRGETHRDERTEEEREAVDVGLGGDLATDTFIDWIAGQRPAETIPAGVKRLTTAYLDDRADPTETFADWLNRTAPETLYTQLVPPEEVA